MSVQEVATLKDKLAQLEAWKSGVLEGRKALSDVVVRSSVDRKLRRYGGNEEETENWIEDARCVTQGLPNKEAVSVIYRHLEGVAREEVKLYPEGVWDAPDKLFAILRAAFGEKRSSAQLKRLIYERAQRKNESLRSYSRALLDLVQRLDDSVEKDAMLCEVFCDNVIDKYLRVELKRKLKGHPNIGFIALREFAIQISEEDEVPTKTDVHSVQSSAVVSHVDQSNLRVLERLEAQMIQMTQMQQQMVGLLGKLGSPVTMPKTSYSPMQGPNSPNVFQGNTTQRSLSYGNARPDRQPLSAVQCHECHQFGHYKRRCPNRRQGPRQSSSGSEMSENRPGKVHHHPLPQRTVPTSFTSETQTSGHKTGLQQVEN